VEKQHGMGRATSHIVSYAYAHLPNCPCALVLVCHAPQLVERSGCQHFY